MNYSVLLPFRSDIYHNRDVKNVDKVEVTPIGAWVMTRGSDENSTIVAIVPPGAFVILLPDDEPAS